MRPTEALVREALGETGLAAAERSAGRLAQLLDLLVEANRSVNLVSRREAVPETLVRRHLVDALQGLALLPPPAGRPVRLLDVGSGGGFPALPLLLVRDDLEGALVEATGKKARFLEAAIQRLGLPARVLAARFPEPVVAALRGGARFDVVTSRAVADAGAIVRQARPVLAGGATALLWTTETLLPEIRAELPGALVTFRSSPGSERRGIARVERFT